jgi:hypothetical protein
MKGTYKFEIPNWIPTSCNILLRCHWAKRSRLLRADAQMVSVYFRQANVPVASGRRRLSAIFSNPRSIDPDNCLKSLLDALSGCRAILDDDPGSMELGSIVSTRGPRSSRIELEDLD